MASTLGPEWIERTRAAALFGVGVRQFDERHRKLASPHGQRKVKGKVFFDFPELLKAFVAGEVLKAKPASDDPLLTGGDSANLEEYRKHKARRAKVEADEAEGIVVRVAVIKPGLLGAMGVLRRAGERLERLHGAEAAKLLTEAVDEAAVTIGQMFDDGRNENPPAGNAVPAGNPDGGKAGPPADDAGVRRS